MIGERDDSRAPSGAGTAHTSVLSRAMEIEIERAAKLLQSGGIGAFPTETVYGLGADAFAPRAIARVFEVKGRPQFDPLIVHLADASWIDRVVREFPPSAGALARRFWPGPLTLVLPKRPEVPELVTAGLETVGVRVPDHPIARALIVAADTPLAAPSANLFGRISPTTAAHVVEQLDGRIDFVLDGGPCRVGLESTVVRVEDDRFVVLRPGGTTLEQLRACTPGAVWEEAQSPTESSAGCESPGLLSKHYAPRTPLTAVEASAIDVPASGSTLRVGLLAFGEPRDRAGFTAVEVLSAARNLQEAAAGFFAALRRLDSAELDRIVAERYPNEGLGRALNDRLHRAAAGSRADD